jgi:hypothetical protein
MKLIYGGFEQLLGTTAGNTTLDQSSSGAVRRKDSLLRPLLNRRLKADPETRRKGMAKTPRLLNSFANRGETILDNRR